MHMADEEVYEYVIPNFAGGLNQAIAEELLQTNETRNAQNVKIDDGNLIVANGCAKYIDRQIPNGIMSLMVFHKDNLDGTIMSYLLASDNSNIYYWNGTAWQAIKTGLQSGRLDFINYQQGSTNIIIMGNGKDPLMKWTGSGNIVNLAGNPPIVKSITLHYERVWGTGDAVNPNRVYWSDDLNPENWTTSLDAGGLMDIPTWDGGKCIGLSNLFDNVVIFKTYNIWKIFGTYPREYEKVQVYSSTGAIAERSIVDAGTMAFFLAKDGIYIYNGTQTQKISQKIKSIIENMNPSYAENAVGVYYKGKYLLAIPEGSSTVNNAVIEYDLQNQNFIVRRGFNVSCFLVYNDMLLFGNENGYVLQYDVGSAIDETILINENNLTFSRNSEAYNIDYTLVNSNTPRYWSLGTKHDNTARTPIDAYWETPYTDIGLPNAVKRARCLYLIATGDGQLQFEYTFDDVTKTLLIDLPDTLQVLKYRLKNKGRRFKFKIRNVNGSQFKLVTPKIQYDIDID